MSTYHRTTRECLASQLKPELLVAMRTFFQTHNLGEVESESLLCCETLSQKTEASWLSSWLDGRADTEIYTGIVLTASSLIWVRMGDQSVVHTVGANLMNIRTRSQISPFSKETRLEINGLVEGAKSIIRGSIALGPEPAAQTFCEEVYQAIEKIKPTPGRKWPSWMGGH